MQFDEFRLRAAPKKQYPDYITRFFGKGSMRLSYLLAHTPVTPNQVTLLSTLVAFLAVAIIQSSVYWIRLLGVVVWFVSFMLDICDGDIARYRKMTSEFGHWFDGVLDRAKDVVLLTAITTSTFWQTGTHWVLWVGLLALGGTLLHTYTISYGYKAAESTSPDSGPLAKFGHIHYALLAVFAVLNYFQIYLLIVALTSLGAVAVSVCLSWKATLNKAPPPEATPS